MTASFTSAAVLNLLLLTISLMRFIDRYQVTVIYRNPDSEIPSKIALLPMCSHERHYTKENLNHDVFNLYF